MEPTHIQGVLITEGWDLEAPVLPLLATARLIDSPSGESALEPPFLGCGRREDEGEVEEIPKVPVKVGRLLEKC